MAENPSKLPDGWWLDTPLKAKRIANCQPEHARRCVERTRFVAPPPHGLMTVFEKYMKSHNRYPYEFEVTVNLKPARGAPPNFAVEPTSARRLIRLLSPSSRGPERLTLVR